VDLRGIQVEFRYSNRDTEIIKDHTLFFTQTKHGGDKYTIAWSTPNTNYDLPDFGRGKVPEGYTFAEWRRLDYYLCYSLNQRDIIRCDLTIPGVLDIQEVMLRKKDVEGKTYYIDDAIDYFNGVQVDLTYNNQNGWFYQNGLEGPGDGKGTDLTATVPIHANWEWSLNYPRSTGQKPYIRINVGNVRQAKEYNSEYTKNRYTNIRLANLYMVDNMEWTVPPALEEKYFSDDVLKYSSWKEQWMQTALKDAVVTVRYVGVNGEAAPKTKRMVANPQGNEELSLFNHLYRWPIVNGPRRLIRQNQDFVVVHDNSEKYGDANIEDGKYYPKWAVAPQPAKVFVLDTDEELIIDPPTFTKPIGPNDKIGSIEELLNTITITGTYNYYSTGTEEEILDTTTKKIDKNDGRLRFNNRRGENGIHRAAGLVDNATNKELPAMGIYTLNYWWRTSETEYEETITYLDWWEDFIPYPEDPMLFDLLKVDAAGKPVPNPANDITEPKLELIDWVYNTAKKDWTFGFNEKPDAYGNETPKRGDGWRMASGLIEIVLEE